MWFRQPYVSCVVMCLLVGVRLAAQTRPNVAGEDLVGLWGAEAVFGPQVDGELLLKRDRRRWTMRVGGFEATAGQVGDSVTIRLPGRQGTLKAWVSSEVPAGFWVQPEGNNPPYATPLRFRSAGVNAWHAELHPLVERFPLYLSVTRAADGTLHGVFRNPAVNWPGRAGWYRVERDGDHVVFIVPKTGEAKYRQPYDSGRRVIAFDFGGPVEVHPRTREQAVGLVPRSPSLPAYEYRLPADLSDGWPVADRSSIGMDTIALRTIVREIVAMDPLDDTLPRLHSLVVARRGRLVLDEYFMGYGPDQMHDLRSASKTVTSVMAGVAMYRGAAFDMSTRVGATTITVGHLLTHTSGLACDDDDDASPGNEDTMQSQHAQNDWYRFFLSLPTAHPPGTTYAYCSAGVNMVGGIIGQATHTWLPLFFERYVARPMGIHRYAVNLMPTGEAYSGGGMHMLPRDLLKFGQLYLDGGRWNGVRLVSVDWVRQSTARQVDRPDGSQDGFAWHRHMLTTGTRSFQTYEASGNGGQFLLVVPELELVVVATAGNYGQYGVWRKIREVLMPKIMQATR
jgi:hypothetical protein